jgi:hypothetical protein
MRNTIGHFLACAVLGALSFGATDARAYRMIQNPSTGRSSTGIRVLCSDPGGFTHWNKSSLSWRLNPANQGGKAGVAAAIQSGLAAWTAVSPAGHALGYGGTTNAGFATDGINTVLWANGNGCIGSCLAITALVIGPGQEILEADVSFNQAYTWNTSGADYDVQAIATHELGHCLGIHHTELTKQRTRPTMYSAYFGTAGRSLESDDRDALNCAASRYPMQGSSLADAGTEPMSPEPTGVALLTRVRAGRTSLRFALRQPGFVRLEVFDVAGRRVATLIDGERGAGEHEIAWDATVPGGGARRAIYFARLETAEGRDGATILAGR